MKIDLLNLGSVCFFKSVDQKEQQFGLIIDIDVERDLCKIYSPLEATRIRIKNINDRAITTISFRQIKAIGPKPNFDVLFKKMKK